MIRNLRVLMLAALLVGALAAINGASAQAAEFHCSFEKCKLTLKPDGTSGTKTAHQVLDVPENGALTCNNIEGSGTTTKKTTTEVTITGIKYNGCNLFGQAVTVNMNGNGTGACDYLFTAAGNVTIGPATCSITIEAPTCTAHIKGGQTFSGVKYHQVTAGSNTELTVEAAVAGIHIVVTAGCPVSGTFTTGEITTANTIVTGELDESPFTHAEVWWL